MDITAFLLERIAEDQAAAQAATAGHWEFAEVSDGWDGMTEALQTVDKLPPWPDGSISPVDTVLSGWGYDACGITVSDEDAGHIARWDPARVLAECAAKRRVVLTAHHAARVARDIGQRDRPYNDILIHMAQPYAGHHDYRTEWSTQ